MGLKSDLTPLESVDLLSSPSRARLRAQHVTTVEELLGLLEADPEGIRALLDLEPAQVSHLRDAAESLVNPDTLRAMSDQRGRTYPGGALRPELGDEP
jgi:hypothetical protein